MADDDGQNAAGGRGKGRGRPRGRATAPRAGQGRGRGRGIGKGQQGLVTVESDSEGEGDQAAAFADLFCDINVAPFPEPPDDTEENEAPEEIREVVEPPAPNFAWMPPHLLSNVAGCIADREFDRGMVEKGNLNDLLSSLQQKSSCTLAKASLNYSKPVQMRYQTQI